MNETITISGSSTDFAVTNSTTTFWVYNTGSDTITLPDDPLEESRNQFNDLEAKFFGYGDELSNKQIAKAMGKAARHHSRVIRDEHLANLMR